MSESLLRRKLIRLAHSKPELRASLLPILKTADDAPVVGMILVSSWGYDQTNVDFYEISRVLNSMVEIREIDKKFVKQGRGVDYVVPIPGKFIGSPLRKRVGYYDGQITVKINSYSSAYQWDGKPESQTSAGYGH